MLKRLYRSTGFLVMMALVAISAGALAAKTTGEFIRDLLFVQPVMSTEDVQFVMDASVDHYEDAILGGFRPVNNDNGDYFFDTMRDGGEGTGEPWDGVSYVVFDHHSLLEGLEGNVVIMGRDQGDVFLACAAWELNATNPRGAFVPPEECFDQS